MILNGCGRMLDGTNAVIVRRDCRVACGETLLEMLDGQWKHILRDLILQIEAEHAAKVLRTALERVGFGRFDREVECSGNALVGEIGRAWGGERVCQYV